MLGTLKDLDYAWAAGFVDGDGCITIHEGAKRRDYHLRLGITQNDPLVLRDVVGAVGVYAGVNTKKSKNVAQMYEVTFASERARLVIERMAPFLIGKRAEAELALEFCRVCEIGKRGSRTLSEEELELRREYRRRTAALKSMAALKSIAALKKKR